MDAHHYAGDLFGAFRLEHLEALMPAHDIPRDLVPDDGIHIAELMQAAPDLFIRRIAGLQVFAGIIFCRFQHGNGHFLNVYFRLYRWQKAHKINPFERSGAIFCVPKKHFIFAKYFTAGRSGPGENAPGDSIPPGAPKPTTPQDFPQAKCKSRLHPGTFARRSAKADNAPGLCCGEVRKPTSLPGVSHGEARKPTRAQDFFTAKRKSRPRRPPLPGPGLLAARPAPAAAKTVRFLIPRGKGNFYETATFRRRKVLFSSPFCGLLFGPGRAKLTVPAGKSPPPEPRPPRGGPPPTTATGSRFSRRQRDRPPRRPRPSPPAREGALGAPNDRTFSEGTFRKARKGKENERRKPHAAPTPRFTHRNSA